MNMKDWIDSKKLFWIEQDKRIDWDEWDGKKNYKMEFFFLRKIAFCNKRNITRIRVPFKWKRNFIEFRVEYRIKVKFYLEEKSIFDSSNWNKLFLKMRGGIFENIFGSIFSFFKIILKENTKSGRSKWGKLLWNFELYLRVISGKR